MLLASGVGRWARLMGVMGAILALSAWPTSAQTVERNVTFSWNWGASEMEVFTGPYVEGWWMTLLVYGAPQLEFSPPNESNLSGGAVQVNLTVSSNASVTLYCNLTIQNVTYLADYETTNATPILIPIGNLTEANYTWEGRCCDLFGRCRLGSGTFRVQLKASMVAVSLLLLSVVWWWGRRGWEGR